MSELGYLLQGIIKIVLVFKAAVLYSMGGRDEFHIGIRRFGSSFILVGTMCVFSFLNNSFSWWFLLCYPLLVLGYSMGYGANTLWKKVRRRSLSAFLICASAIPVVLITQRWELFFTQVIVGIMVMVVLGVESRVLASQEELIIGFLTGFAYPFYV